LVSHPSYADQSPAPRDQPARLAGLRASTGLTLPDCCVLLAAEQVDGAIVTFEDRLAAAARERGIDVRPE
jgi:predicted nucleic acid-binding protein